MTRILMNRPKATLRTRLARFSTDTDGAVTVDWVVLTAAIVGLGIAVLTSVSGGTTALASKTSSAISDMEVGGSGTAGAGPTEDFFTNIPNTGTFDCPNLDTCYVSDTESGTTSTRNNPFSDPVSGWYEDGIPYIN
ncbi:Flp family type IVb pilin [Maritimibacter sp. DP1N21-5]|uniref:Flp family type IVb pilin n=1 Tax=Maritimibacter sp. DP1N21-5 TaxID=2836867 RepID=UPI002102B8BF|nr:hypothetical protein [Maritimibacter sp. DP1N21-5]